MISDEFRFQQFVEIATGKPYHEIIYLAEQEALQAWRKAHPSKGLSNEERIRSLRYQQMLLDLIEYLRHGVVFQDRDEKTDRLFQFLREEARRNDLMVS